MKHTEIDTRVGTHNYSNFSNGNTLPLTGSPFAMNYFAVQNGEGSWWFDPLKPMISGFRCTHQPSPWMGDFSHFLITPFTGNPLIRSLFHLQSSYRTQEAIFRPDFLQVESLRYNIKSELTASTYGMKLRTTSSDENSIKYVLSAHSGIRNISQDHNSITFDIKNYSGCEDKDFTMHVILTADTPLKLMVSKFEDGSDIAIIETDVTCATLSLATSFISSAQAALNLSREPETFTLLHQQVAATWNEKLDKIVVTHKDKEAEKMFYAAFYRCFLFPQTFYELDESMNPIHYNTISKQVAPGVLFTNNGFWDTYKTLFPLFSLIEPDFYELLLRGFLNSYNESGYLPKWLSPDERGLMPGTLIDAVISDALTKGIAQDMIHELYDAMVKSATVESANPQYGRRAVNDYWKYGYVPSHYGESVNQSLDNSYSDFCIAQVAKLLNKNDDYEKFMTSSRNYAKLFDLESGLMRARDTYGNFVAPFTDTMWGHAYTEGSSWQNSWAVYHDFKGLINLYSNQDDFIQVITHLINQKPIFSVGSYGFEIHEMSEVAAIDFGQMAISNQPSFHIPYLFTYAGHPESTQVLIRSLMRETFKPTFDGYPGDEDNGSMSAWYVFNSLGFYPVCPGSQEYVMGIPYFDSVVINLPHNKTIEITTENNTPHHNFINDVKVNGSSYTHLYFKHKDLIQGANIKFELGIVPHFKSYTDEQLPYSSTK